MSAIFDQTPVYTVRGKINIQLTRYVNKYSLLDEVDRAWLKGMELGQSGD